MSLKANYAPGKLEFTY